MTPNDIFALIASSLQQGDLPAAKERFFANRDTLYEANPLLTIKTNFELRFISGEFERAYEDNEYFQSLPYISQEVEEYLRQIPRLIRSNELASFARKGKSEDEILTLLEGPTKDEELLFLLSTLEKQDITPYVEALKALLVKDVHDDVKTFALLLLVAKGIKGEVTFIKGGETLVLDPSRLGLPFQNEDYDELKKEVGQSKDIAIGEIAAKLLDQLALSYYPRRPLLRNDRAFTKAALLSLAAHYLDPKSPLSEEGAVLEETLKANQPLGE